MKHALYLILPFFLLMGFSTVALPDRSTGSIELGINELSPRGLAGGKLIPASCPSDLHDEPSYGQACSAVNACGASNPGSIQCGGACSANPPALPANYGTPCASPANACGLRNFGSIGCTNNCSAQFAPPQSQCTLLNAPASTLVIHKNGNILSWQGQGSCAVYNDSGQIVSTETSGSLTLPPSTLTQRYILTCGNESVSSGTPDPRFQEF